MNNHANPRGLKIINDMDHWLEYLGRSAMRLSQVLCHWALSSPCNGWIWLFYCWVGHIVWRSQQINGLDKVMIILYWSISLVSLILGLLDHMVRMDMGSSKYKFSLRISKKWGVCSCTSLLRLSRIEGQSKRNTNQITPSLLWNWKPKRGIG